MIRNFEEVAFDQIAWSDDATRTTFRRVPPLLRLSVREVGVLNPLIVAETQVMDRFAIITGWLRFQAAKEVGENSVPCHIYRSFPPKILLLCSIFDNLGHRHMNVVEQAITLKKLAEYYSPTEIKRTFLPLLGVHLEGDELSSLERLADLEEDLRWGVADGTLHTATADAISTMPHGHRQHVLRLFKYVRMSEPAQLRSAQSFETLRQKHDLTPLEIIREENWATEGGLAADPDERLEQDLLQLEVGLAATPTLFGERRSKSSSGRGNVLVPGQRAKPATEADTKKRPGKRSAPAPLTNVRESDVLQALTKRLGKSAKLTDAAGPLPEGTRLTTGVGSKGKRLEVDFADEKQLCSALRKLLDAEERGALRELLSRT